MTKILQQLRPLPEIPDSHSLMGSNTSCDVIMSRDRIIHRLSSFSTHVMR